MFESAAAISRATTRSSLNERPWPPASDGRRSAPNPSTLSRAISSCGRRCARSRSAAVEAISAMASEKPSDADNGETSLGPPWLIVVSDMLMPPLEVSGIVHCPSNLDAVIRDVDSRVDDLAFREPVGGALELRNESGVVGFVELIHARKAGQIVADLIRIFGFLLCELLGFGGVRRLPRAFDVVRVDHRANQLGILFGKFPACHERAVVDQEIEVASLVEDVLCVVRIARDVDCRRPHRPRIDYALRKGRCGIGRIQVDELDLDPPDAAPAFA